MSPNNRLKKLKKFSPQIFMAIGFVLISTGLCLSARPGYHLIKSKVFEWKSEKIWAEWKETIREKTGSGDPIAWIKSPGAHLNHLVLWNATKTNLRLHPCLTDFSTGFKKPGLNVILAHRDYQFKHLDNLEKGDHFFIETVDGKNTFVVIDKEVLLPDEATQRLESSKKRDLLVLMTCYPIVYTGPAPKRFLLWAEEVPPPQPKIFAKL